MTLEVGTRLGPYEIVAPLGAGGMGEVYRAKDTRLEREVAIKILPEHLADNPTRKARFEREAKAISQLTHPHICTLYDVGNDDGVEYLVMELVDGESLAERLTQGALPIDQVLRYGIEIADALEAAHKHGIVHRDLKPGNVMLTKAGVKLLDFGLAKHRAAAQGEIEALTSLATEMSPSQPLTAQGTIMGTFQYMAPEQLEGEETDERGDIFALGCVLYEMATGKKAFTGKSRASLIGAILNQEPEPLATLQPMSPPALDRLVSTCLAKDPDDRFQTAHDVKLQLQWIAEGGSQVGAPAVVSARRRSREKLAWASAAGLLLSTLFGLWFGFVVRAPKTPRVVRAAIELPVEYLHGSDPLAFSPDGKTLAIAATEIKDKQHRIYLRALDGSAPRALDGTKGADCPTWSPDGRSLAFFADGKLEKIDVASGVTQTLADAPRGFGITWGPDGTIVYAPNVSGPLWKVSADGGKAAAAEKGVPERVQHLYPHFLPDGKSLLYVSRYSPSSQKKDEGLFALDLATGKSRRLLPDHTEGRYVPPGYLAFKRDGNLMVQRFDPKTLKLSGKALPVAQNVLDGFYAFGHGDLLAYETNPGGDLAQLTWFDSNAKLLGTVGKPMDIHGLRVSPDGRRAVVRIGADPAAQLWMVDLATGVASPFTLGKGDKFNPVWSPDGTRVLYGSELSQDPASMESLFVKKTDGGSPPEKIASIGPTGQTEVGPKSWSPDGSVVAYIQKSPDTKSWDIGILSMTGNHQRRLVLHGPANEVDPNFSPDGKWLSYISDESGTNQLYVIPYPGPGGRWQISADGCAGYVWVSNHEIYNIWDGGLHAIDLKAGPHGGLEIGSRRQVQLQSYPPTARGFDYSLAQKRTLLAVPVGFNLHLKYPPITLVTHWTRLLRTH